MHDTAMDYGSRFFATYAAGRSNLVILDVGAQDVNGSLRSVAPPDAHYIGLDFVEARGVDIVITDLYALPMADQSVDVVVSSSCFEHSEFFWLLFNECMRVLKPNGLLYINVPSNGPVHRFPVDCWRFYPDSGRALEHWGIRSGFDCRLLESFVGIAKTDVWEDFIAVFLKDARHAKQFPDRLLDAPIPKTSGSEYRA
jgi:SAM-dependent methyltransferase